jgi:hypothetical protein
MWHVAEHVARGTWHPARCTLHVARGTWHVARGTLHVARGTLHVARGRATWHAWGVPVLLIATYDLGRQPFGLASAAAALDAVGLSVTCADLSRDPLRESAVREANLIAFFLPMHTATRLALPVIDRVRTLNPQATLCAYGLYALLNAAILKERGVTEIIGGEFEDDLAALALRTPATPHVGASSTPHVGASSTPHVSASSTPHVSASSTPHVSTSGTPHVSTSGTLHVARGTWHVARGTLHVARGTLHVARGTLHVARGLHVSQRSAPPRLARAAGAARGTWHVAPGTSHVTPGPSSMSLAATGPSPDVPRVHFTIPLRESLPPLERYASLQWGRERRTVGYTEASRGCKHRCRHCPIVPVYDGRFRIVPREVVIEDIRRQVAAGAQHITFGDPDFFNGPRHAIAILRELASKFPRLSYDVTIKVEHLLKHAALLPELAATGCAFITSAVESIDDRVLAKLDKGHTAADFEAVVALCRGAGVILSPTFVAFTPWTTIEGYCALLQTIDRLDLIGHVAPIQLTIRLLIPEGSRLLELEDIRASIGPFDPHSLTYRWAHEVEAVDGLQEAVAGIVGKRLNAPRGEVFAEIWTAAHRAAGLDVPLREARDLVSRAAVPYLNEPWYC